MRLILKDFKIAGTLVHLSGNLFKYVQREL